MNSGLLIGPLVGILGLLIGGLAIRIGGIVVGAVLLGAGVWLSRDENRDALPSPLALSAATAADQLRDRYAS